MKVTVDTRAPADASADLLALPLPKLPKGRRLPPRIAAIDRGAGGVIRRAIDSGDWSGKAGQTALLYPSGKLRAKRLLLVGLGKPEGVDAETLRAAAGRAIGQALQCKARRVVIAVPRVGAAAEPGGAQALAEGALLASYRFDAYRGKDEDEDEKPPISAVALLAERGVDVRSAREAARRGVILGESQNLARDLSNAPGNALPPAELAAEARRVAREVGLKVRVFDERELAKRKMNAILAVGSGSSRPPRMITLEYTPKKGGRRAAEAAPFCIVGKGVTFDSGGISIKPSAAMDEMKHDMSGAAAVIGAMRAAALLELPIPIVAVIGAAENMPSATAYRPGDVLKAASGKTIEVLNTDAEGRVVLADALHWARTEFEPCAIVDLATLTGACMVALGKWATGLFSPHEKLSAILAEAGDATAERAWPMPLLEGHKEEIRSQVADIKNTGGRAAGASTAAAFLWHFVGDTPWAHLDIAGTAWTSASGPYQPRGATGVGVRLLAEVLQNWDPASLD